MNTYTMTCTCGDKMSLEAATRDEAVAKFKEMMNADGIAKHMAEKHPGDPLIPVEECHKMIEETTEPKM